MYLGRDRLSITRVQVPYFCARAFVRLVDRASHAASRYLIAAGCQRTGLLNWRAVYQRFC
jgi:hypothetical protein